MGTQKGSNTKKASGSPSAKHGITTNPKHVTRSPRLSPLKRSKAPESTLQPTASPHFPLPASIVNSGQAQKHWQEWEQQLLVSLRQKGKTNREISKHLPGRSKRACQEQLLKLLKHGEQNPYPLLEDDRAEFRALKNMKRWKDWEDQIIISNYNAGKSWGEISELLPSRTEKATLARWKQLPKFKSPNPPESKWSQYEDRLLGSLRTARKDWAEIAQQIPNHSRYGCRQRWTQDLHYHSSKKWTKQEKETLMSLVKTVGYRWYEIAKFIPGRTGVACRCCYVRYWGEEDGEGGPSPEDWIDIWDSESLVHRLQTELTTSDPPNPEETDGETEIDSMELESTARDANQEMDFDVGESASAPVNPAPTAEKDQYKSFNAKKKQAIYVPEI
ncbi:hypothetical protein HO133_003831 [Letharia lupina]|uniref:Uncharacterized protein n=1 Tax=Letharia lupina TaxID=560253 RepID=A0A8H6CB50_9LECA|nr:uncharacterized protein HO133_003831 [Letharia lupina]KAF6220006.1 hypothetical protein HO133_003831 [Letharia lupina]